MADRVCFRKFLYYPTPGIPTQERSNQRHIVHHGLDNTFFFVKTKYICLIFRKLQLKGTNICIFDHWCAALASHRFFCTTCPIPALVRFYGVWYCMKGFPCSLSLGNADTQAKHEPAPVRWQGCALRLFGAAQVSEWRRMYSCILAQGQPW